MTAVGTTRRALVTGLSSARFTVRNFGLNTVAGTAPITGGWVDVDAAGSPCAVHASIDLGSLDTGNARRDRDLRKPSLLDLDRYPTLEFTGLPRPADQDAAGQGRPGQDRTERSWTVQGTLEARGASTPIDLAATSSEAPDGTTTVHAHGEFDRRDLSVRAPRILIGHRVRARLEVTLAPTRQ